MKRPYLDWVIHVVSAAREVAASIGMRAREKRRRRVRIGVIWRNTQPTASLDAGQNPKTRLHRRWHSRRTHALPTAKAHSNSARQKLLSLEKDWRARRRGGLRACDKVCARSWRSAREWARWI